jgi:hypothetical protein
MTQETFIEAVKIAVANTAVAGMIEEMKQPPGRRPAQEMVDREIWFNALPETQKQMVESVITRAIDKAVFGFLAVLDNVRSIEDQGPKGDLKLFYVKDGQRTQLNGNDQEKLHDIYNQI